METSKFEVGLDAGEIYIGKGHVFEREWGMLALQSR